MCVEVIPQVQATLVLYCLLYGVAVNGLIFVLFSFCVPSFISGFHNFCEFFAYVTVF